MSIFKLLLCSAPVRPKHYYDASLNQALGLLVFLIVLGLLVVLLSWCLWERNRKSIGRGVGGPVLPARDANDPVSIGIESLTGVDAAALLEENVRESGIPITPRSTLLDLSGSSTSGAGEAHR